MQQKTSLEPRRLGEGQRQYNQSYQRSHITQPRFKNDIYFPEQDGQCESSTAYETNGPTPTAVRHRLAGIAAGISASSSAIGAGGIASPVGSTVGVLGGVGSVAGDIKGDAAGIGANTAIGAGDVSLRGRAKDSEKTEYTASTCMALSGRGDDLLFFEAGLQEYFYRNALATAILRLLIVVSSAVLFVCLLHNGIYFIFACARFVLDESVVSAFSVFERHPLLTWTRWVSFSWAGIVAFAALVIAVAAKRSACLRHPEVACARLNNLYLGRQFGMHFEVHTDTLNVCAAKAGGDGAHATGMR